LSGPKFFRRPPTSASMPFAGGPKKKTGWSQPEGGKGTGPGPNFFYRCLDGRRLGPPGLKKNQSVGTRARKGGGPAEFRQTESPPGPTSPAISEKRKAGRSLLGRKLKTRPAGRRKTRGRGRRAVLVARFYASALRGPTPAANRPIWPLAPGGFFGPHRGWGGGSKSVSNCEFRPATGRGGAKLCFGEKNITPFPPLCNAFANSGSPHPGGHFAPTPGIRFRPRGAQTPGRRKPGRAKKPLWGSVSGAAFYGWKRGRGGIETWAGEANLRTRGGFRFAFSEDHPG